MARTKDFDESEVLKKAISIFWDKGYNGTSMQDLVDGLGISRSSLYDTFGDKQKLYLKALEGYQQQNNQQFDCLVNKAPDAKIAIKHVLELIVDNLLGDVQRKGCFMVNAGIELASHDEQVNALLCRNEKQMEEFFFTVIKQGQEKGEISTQQTAQALARFLNNTVKGMQVSVKSTTDRKFFEDIVQTAITVLG